MGHHLCQLQYLNVDHVSISCRKYSVVSFIAKSSNLSSSMDLDSYIENNDNPTDNNKMRTLIIELYISRPWLASGFRSIPLPPTSPDNRLC